MPYQNNSIQAERTNNRYDDFRLHLVKRRKDFVIELFCKLLKTDRFGKFLEKTFKRSDVFYFQPDIERTVVTVCAYINFGAVLVRFPEKGDI